jgi:hypothetical protein
MIGVRFTAAAGGPRTATLSFGANTTYPPDPTVSLTGTGVAADSGPTGPHGDTGAQGPSGAHGATGAQGALVLVAYQAKVTAGRVVVSCVLTGPAGIALRVATNKGRPVTVAKARARAGVNRLTWNRRLKGKRARSGAYRLLVTATAGKETATSRLSVRLR